MSYFNFLRGNFAVAYAKEPPPLKLVPSCKHNI